METGSADEETAKLIAKQNRLAKVQTLQKSFLELLVEAYFTQDRQLTKVDDQFNHCLPKVRQQKEAEFLAPLKKLMQYVQNTPFHTVQLGATINDGFSKTER